MTYSSITMLCELMLYSKVTQLHILFHYVWSQYIDQSSLCCTAGPCLSVLYIPVCICWPRILNIVPCAIQLDLVYPFYTYQFASASPKSQSNFFPPHFPLATTSLFSMSLILFMFYRYVHLCHILDSTFK